MGGYCGANTGGEFGAAGVNAAEWVEVGIAPGDDPPLRVGEERPLHRYHLVVICHVVKVRFCRLNTRPVCLVMLSMICWRTD